MTSKTSTLQKVSDILTKFNPLEDKYISREFQAYGIYLSEELNDTKHKALYIKLAKTLPRALLEKALSYAKDSDFRKKGALFMWRLKKLGAWDKNKSKIKDKKSKSKGRKKKAGDIPF